MSEEPTTTLMAGVYVVGSLVLIWGILCLVLRNCDMSGGSPDPSDRDGPQWPGF